MWGWGSVGVSLDRAKSGAPDAWFNLLQVCGTVRSERGFIGIVCPQLGGSGHHRLRYIH